ncbi:MAG: ParA family protein [Burkholderiales bacterium]|nr:ParA family protein [Burkholderiales bacterium]PZN00081.1 MAG: cobyrinic acid a,c-diamide synthase [Pseudomonadota bacterium]
MLRSVLVVNPKGGAGKTTLAVNLAAGLAYAGEGVCLWDLDRQHSALQWLARRPDHLPPIARLDQRDQAPREASWLVLDSPAALHGKRLQEMLKQAHKVLVPIQPSLFDIAASGAFLRELREDQALSRRKAIGVIGMRVDPRTRAATQLANFLREHDVPLVGWLRDTQLYPNAAFQGESIFDLPPYLAEREVAMWEPILAWVRNG